MLIVYYDSIRIVFFLHLVLLVILWIYHLLRSRICLVWIQFFFVRERWMGILIFSISLPEIRITFVPVKNFSLIKNCLVWKKYAIYLGSWLCLKMYESPLMAISSSPNHATAFPTSSIFSLVVAITKSPFELFLVFS